MSQSDDTGSYLIAMDRFRLKSPHLDENSTNFNADVNFPHFDVSLSGLSFKLDFLCYVLNNLTQEVLYNGTGVVDISDLKLQISTHKDNNKLVVQELSTQLVPETLLTIND